MTDIKHKSDYTFAQRICASLQKGATEAIETVYNRFHPFFLVFAKKRLRTLSAYYEHDALSVLDKYWIELMNGKYICQYEGKGTLENYLWLRLKDRIIDKIRNLKSVNKQHLPEPPPSPETPEDQLISKQIKQIIFESLLEFATKFPRDAHYIKMYLEKKNYKQMALDELLCENPDEAMVKKKADAIKVQFTRKKTGSLARYEKILMRNMDKHEIDIRDLLSADWG